MFMEIAIGAIGVGVVLMVGYLVVAQIVGSLPTPQIANECLGRVGNITYPECDGLDNTSALVDDAGYVTGISGTQATIFAGFSLVAVGIIVLAAFGLINVFR